MTAPPSAEEVAARIVSDIVMDLCGRKGLRHVWDTIEDETATEIIAKWNGLARNHLIGDPR